MSGWYGREGPRAGHFAPAQFAAPFAHGAEKVKISGEVAPSGPERGQSSETATFWLSPLNSHLAPVRARSLSRPMQSMPSSFGST